MLSQASSESLIAVAGLLVVSLYAMFLWLKLHLTFQIMREMRYNSTIQEYRESQSEQGCSVPVLLTLVALGAAAFLYVSLH